MTISLFLVVITIFILTVSVIGGTVYYRNEIPIMTGMKIAMGLGMSVGLVSGLLIGIILSGNLFISTVLGMTIGFTAGFLPGMAINTIAVLDGMLAGIMGGMMGAMLGDMILYVYWDSIIKIMFMLFVATCLILLFIIQEEVASNRPLFKSLFIITILFLILLVGFNQAGPIFHEKDIHDHNEGLHTVH